LVKAAFHLVYPVKYRVENLVENQVTDLRVWITCRSQTAGKPAANLSDYQDEYKIQVLYCSASHLRTKAKQIRKSSSGRFVGLVQSACFYIPLVCVVENLVQSQTRSSTNYHMSR